MSGFELEEFLAWMAYHKPSDKQIHDAMNIYDISKVMQTVAAEIVRLRAERDEARGGDCYPTPVPTTLDKLAEQADAAYTSYIAASAADEVAVNAAASATTARYAALEIWITSKNAYFDARRETP